MLWEEIKMKKSKEYKICIVFMSLALVLFCVSIVTGLIPNLTFAIDKISQFLGFAFFGLGLVFWQKSKHKYDN